MFYVNNTEIYGIFIKELIGLTFSSVKFLFSAYMCELALYLHFYVYKEYLLHLSRALQTTYARNESELRIKVNRF